MTTRIKEDTNSNQKERGWRDAETQGGIQRSQVWRKVDFTASYGRKEEMLVDNLQSGFVDGIPRGGSRMASKMEAQEIENLW